MLTLPLTVNPVKVPREVTPDCAASTFKVTSPEVPPPDNPVPATTEVMSPGRGDPLFCNVPTKLIVSPLSPIVRVVPD